MAARALIARILSPFRPPPIEGRQLQLSVDAATLYTLIKSRTRHNFTSHPPDPHLSSIADILGVPHLPAIEHQAPLLISYLHARIRTILRATHDAIISPRPLELSVTQSLGFCPVIRQSHIPSAGRGVFIEGVAKAGEVCALYPGMSFLPSQLRRANVTPSDYAISRYDGVTIDGAADVSLDLSDIFEEHNVDIYEKQLVHPFANGHLINHPARGNQPNALQFMIDLDIGALPSGLRELVPVENSTFAISYLDRLENLGVRQRVSGVEMFLRPIPDERIRRTMAIVALRDITEEELFINYRFNPAIQAPDWYHDCDPQSSERRWKSQGFVV